MPLTPLPASNTKRYFIRWVAGPYTHHTQIRVQDSIDNATALAAFQNDLNILLPALGDNVIIDGLEVAENGSDIRNPVTGWSTLTGSAGGNISGQDFARSFSMRGRSASGRKVKILLWGFAHAHQDDFELALANQTAAESDFQAQVQARSNCYLAIDGSSPDWRTNYLEDYNDHWVGEARP